MLVSSMKDDVVEQIWIHDGGQSPRRRSIPSETTGAPPPHASHVWFGGAHFFFFNNEFDRAQRPSDPADPATARRPRGARRGGLRQSSLFLPISRDRASRNHVFSINFTCSIIQSSPPQMQAFPALSSPLPVYASADRCLLLSLLLARSVVSSFLLLLFNNMKSYDQVTSAWSALFSSSYWHSLTRNSHCFARIHWHSVLC